MRDFRSLSIPISFKSNRHPEFNRHYEGLPESIREQARLAFALFEQNPAHPGLQFKRLETREPYYSARIGRNYRALCLCRDGVALWFRIGPHHRYERKLADL